MNTSRIMRRTRSAFTLIEIIVVIIIIGVLATLIAPRLIGRVGQAKQATAVSKAAEIAGAMKLLITDCGMPPQGSTLDILMKCPSWADKSAWHGPYFDNADQLIDPWGKPFVLRIPGVRNPDFDIVSLGKDGAPGGEGEDADIVKP
jgi:general secretion pathway protein G